MGLSLLPKSGTCEQWVSLRLREIDCLHDQNQQKPIRSSTIIALS